MGVLQKRVLVTFFNINIHSAHNNLTVNSPVISDPVGLDVSFIIVFYLYTFV